MGTIALLFLIPSITDINNTLSIYILARRVSFGEFIQRIDAVFILIWVMSIFSYLAVVMHCILNAFKKVTMIKHNYAMVYCFSAFMYIISMIPANISDQNYFENTFYKYTSIVFVFFITFGIMIAAYIKKKHELKKGDTKLEQTT